MKEKTRNDVKGEEYMSDEIKIWLKKNRGGLLITDRQIGKSRALLELLHEDEDSYILSDSLKSRKVMRRKYREMFSDNKVKRIIIASGIIDINKTYIDEYLWHKILYKKFKGAVSSVDFSVAMI